jgi:hypothetical protein
MPLPELRARRAVVAHHSQKNLEGLTPQWYFVKRVWMIHLNPSQESREKRAAHEVSGSG